MATEYAPNAAEGSRATQRFLKGYFEFWRVVFAPFSWSTRLFRSRLGFFGLVGWAAFGVVYFCLFSVGGIASICLLALVAGAFLARVFVRGVTPQGRDHPFFTSRVLAAAGKELSELAAWASLGICVVLFIEFLFFVLGRAAIDLQLVEQVEARIFDGAQLFRTVTAAKSTAAILLYAGAAAIVLRSAQPIFVSSNTLKIASAFATLLAAASSFTFVSAKAAESRQNEIVVAGLSDARSSLERTAEARERIAALHFVADELSRLEASPRSNLVGDVSSLLVALDQLCASQRVRFEHEYRETIASNGYTESESADLIQSGQNAANSYCRPQEIFSQVAARMVSNAAAPTDAIPTRYDLVEDVVSRAPRDLQRAIIGEPIAVSALDVTRFEPAARAAENSAENARRILFRDLAAALSQQFGFQSSNVSGLLVATLQQAVAQELAMDADKSVVGALLRRSRLNIALPAAAHEVRTASGTNLHVMPLRDAFQLAPDLPSDTVATIVVGRMWTVERQSALDTAAVLAARSAMAAAPAEAATAERTAAERAAARGAQSEERSLGRTLLRALRYIRP